MSELSYKDAGVDIEAGARAVEKIRAAVQSTYTPEVIGDIGGFGGLYSAAAFSDMQDPILVSATDGVGTKLQLAQRLGRHSTVGIDLVAMCVNDLVVCGARPLFFLDYLAVGKLDDDIAAELVGGVAEGCRQAGCALIGGEMAEHPGVMSATDYDLAGFAVGVVERSAMLGRERVEAGDQIIGLASNGLHSNGYSLVRKAWTDKLTNQQLLEDRIADGSTVADAVLAPTRIYVQSLLAAYQIQANQAAGYTTQAGEAARHWPLAIKAAAHITGGGISENLNRSLPADCNALVNLDSWPVPEVIKAAIAAANLSLPEALKTFNMGIGMAVIVAPDDLLAMLAHFSREQKAYHIGSVVAAEETSLGGQVIYNPAPAGQTSLE